MCVVVESPYEKIVEFPPIIITARRVSDLEIEITMQRLTLNWNPTSETFDVVTHDAGISVRPAQNKQPAPQQQPTQSVTMFKVVSRTIVNGYLYVSVDFFYADGSYAFSGNYFYAGGEYWYNNNGIWYGSPDFTVGSFHPGPLPPATLTPPTPPSGGGKPELPN